MGGGALLSAERDGLTAVLKAALRNLGSQTVEVRLHLGKATLPDDICWPEHAEMQLQLWSVHLEKHMMADYCSRNSIQLSVLELALCAGCKALVASGEDSCHNCRVKLDVLKSIQAMYGRPKWQKETAADSKHHNRLFMLAMTVNDVFGNWSCHGKWQCSGCEKVKRFTTQPCSRTTRTTVADAHGEEHWKCSCCFGPGCEQDSDQTG